MMAQLEQLCFVNPFGFTSVPTAVLADRLADLAPLGGDARIFFTSGGSESVESALKMAKQYRLPRASPPLQDHLAPNRLARHHVGPSSVNGLTEAELVRPARPRRPPRPDVAPLPLPLLPVGQRLHADLLRRDRAAGRVRGRRHVAAIIMEPVQNAGGCIPPGSDDYFPKIRSSATRRHPHDHGRGHLRFGRLGELFASTYYGVSPT
jgi:adenosylmethionine-8-amino-7-oxononanoate aminotransferase